MIDFMIVALPRCGTTWASNWLTTEFTHCTHDPLYTTHYRDWDEKLSLPGRVSGVSCTGIWRWADWLNDHPARKVILHRDLGEIQKSMEEIGLPGVIGPDEERQLRSVIGLHVPFTDLFESARASEIWQYLVPGRPFNRIRHRELINIEMQPKFSGLKVGPEVTRKLISELQGIV